MRSNGFLLNADQSQFSEWVQLKRFVDLLLCTVTAAGKELLLNGQPAWVAAQAQIEELLGKGSAMALITVAERLVNAMERSSMPS